MELLERPSLQTTRGRPQASVLGRLGLRCSSLWVPRPRPGLRKTSHPCHCLPHPTAGSRTFWLTWLLLQRSCHPRPARGLHIPQLPFSFYQERRACKVLDDLVSVLSPASDLLQSQLLILASTSFSFPMRGAEMPLEQTWLKLFDMCFISTFPEPRVVPGVQGRHPAKVCWLREGMNQWPSRLWGRLIGTCSSAPRGIPLSGLKKVPYSVPDVISQDNGGNFGTDVFCVRKAHCVKTYSYGNNKLWWWWFF